MRQNARDTSSCSYPKADVHEMPNITHNLAKADFNWSSYVDRKQYIYSRRVDSSARAVQSVYTYHDPNSRRPRIWPMSLGQRFDPKGSS